MVNIEEPLVSIIIPSFNKPDLLIEMIESIISQTYTNWELIIVDDGSEPLNFEKVKSFVIKDPRCFIFRRDRDPKNGDTCRNIGMDKARGKYLIIFDSDDIISPSCLENRVAFMEKHPDCNYSSFPYIRFIDGDKFPQRNKKIFSSHIPEQEILSSLLKADYPFTVWSNIYLKESINDIRWDEKVLVYQDFDFMFSCAVAGLKHEFCDTAPDYYYRQFNDGNNVSGNYVSIDKARSTVYLFSKTLTVLSQKRNFELFRKDFFEFIILHYHRLLLNGTQESIDEYIAFVGQFYSQTFRFRCIRFISRLRNGKLKILLVNYCVGIVFGKQAYISTANMLLKHRVLKVFTNKKE